MPLFTTWYALIPGIILFLTGGIRPYAPRQGWDPVGGCGAPNVAVLAEWAAGGIPERGGELQPPHANVYNT